MQTAGEAVVRELDRRKVIAKAALWFYVPEQSDWRLLIATPEVRTVGPRKLYKTLQQVLSKTESSVKLSSVALLDSKDPLITLLSKAIGTGEGIKGLRFSRNTIDGHFIEDAFIYRMAA
jgi:hypothetical protein